MKTKFKYFSLAIAALLMVGFASCSSDDEPAIGVEENKTVSVTLKIDLGATTRAEVAPIGADVKATFTTADVYFTTAQGAILKYCTVGKDVTGFDKLDITTSGTGVTVTGLPGNTTQVYVFGNTPAGVSLPTNGPISKVKATAISLLSQKDIGNVNLYGTSGLTLVTEGNIGDATNAKYSANVQIKPTVARIELDQMEAEHNLLSFSVVGIFVDNYYQEGNVDGTVSATLSGTGNNLVAISQTADHYARSTDNKYTEALAGVNHDWYETVKPTEDLIAKPSGTYVWGYNLFGKTETSAVPRIVIRIKDVVTNDESAISFAGQDWFLTIKGFKNKTGSAAIDKIEPGNVYKISGLKFCGTNLSPAPNLVAKDITVTVEVLPWGIVEMTPELS